VEIQNASPMDFRQNQITNGEWLYATHPKPSQSEVENNV
jgi:hypothetical protein